MTTAQTEARAIDALAARAERWKHNADNARVSVPIGEIRTALAEIARCHSRLEIDHHFIMGEGEELVRVDIPYEDRANEVDGIEARDATIALQDERVDALQAQVERLRIELGETQLVLEQTERNADRLNAEKEAAEAQVERLTRELKIADESIVLNVKRYLTAEAQLAALKKEEGRAE